MGRYRKLFNAGRRLYNRYAGPVAGAVAAYSRYGKRRGSVSAGGSRPNKRLRFSLGNGYKLGGGRTSTRSRRSKRGRTSRQNIFEGTSFCQIPCGVRKKYQTKMERAMHTKGKYQVITTGRQTGGANQQQAFNVNMYTTTDIGSMFTKIGFVNSSSLTMDEGLQFLHVANMDNNDCVIWFYDLLLRADVNTGTLAPISDWAQGVVDESGAAGDYQIPFSTPFQSKKFCERWKVVKVSRVILSSGSTHIHKVTSKPMHPINYEHLVNTSSSYTGTQGANVGVRYLTSSVMCVIQGNLANDSVTKTQVGTGPVAVDFMNIIRYKYCGSVDNQTLYSKSFTAQTLNTAEFIQEKTGAVVVDAQA